MKYKIAFESLAIFSLVILVISAASSFNFVSDESSEIIPNAYALKSKGVYNTEINSKLVCGDRLCSEIDGGRTTFEVEMKSYGQEEPLDETFDEPVVRDIGEDIVNWGTKTYDSIASDIDKTVKDVTAALETALRDVRNAADIVIDDVGKFSKETWVDAKKLAVTEWDDVKSTYDDIRNDVTRIINNFDKEAMCAASATMICAK